jgi:hypothetical protein
MTEIGTVGRLVGKESRGQDFGNLDLILHDIGGH